MPFAAPQRFCWIPSSRDAIAHVTLIELRMKMRAFATALFAASALGFLVSLVSHIAAYSDRMAQTAVRFIPVQVFLCLPLGVFVLFSAFLLFASVVQPRQALAVVLKETPGWFRWGIWAIVLYIVVNLVLTYSLMRENESPGIYMVRTFSGQVMCVYLFLMALSYLALRVAIAIAKLKHEYRFRPGPSA